MIAEDLYRLATDWEGSARKDTRDHYPYLNTLDDIFFHSSFRYQEYKQFQYVDGPFESRFISWLENVHRTEEKQALVQLAGQLVFIDDEQMDALYRDAYRRIIVPWLHPTAQIDELLDPKRNQILHDAMEKISLFTITESLNIPNFLKVNDLTGLEKPTTLGENLKLLPNIVTEAKPKSRVVVLEDFVGTGKQASRILSALRDSLDNETQFFLSH